VSQAVANANGNADAFADSNAATDSLAKLLVEEGARAHERLAR
jgi:hypothetical protein